MTTLTETQGQLIYAKIESVMANPLNPRKDDSVKTEELQEIIKSKGWQEPLTGYKQGDFYVLLGGHRRLYAAQMAKIKKIPIFEIPKPASQEQEVEMIFSLQNARVDWSAYDRAKFTHERWVAWNKPSLKKFSEQIGVKKRTLEEYITVIEYYPQHLIETDLFNKSISISMLYEANQWIKKLKKYKPELVESMTEDMIKKVMVKKIADRKVDKAALRNGEYCELASEDEIRGFLIDKNRTLENHVGYMGIQKRMKDFRGHMISIGHMERRLQNIKPETDQQTKQTLEALEELQKQINARILELQK